MLININIIIFIYLFHPIIQIIRINLPDLTAERRTELAKNVRRLSEEAKVSIRNIRREANDTLKNMMKQ